MTSIPVSILMPAYNAERFVAEAVASVLAQTHRDFELLAIDDGSADGTPGILADLAAADDRIRVIAHANMGMGRALNNAMTLARHDWIARMDADDVMMPNRLERQLAFVAERPSVVVASSLVQYIDERGASLGRSRCEYTDPGRIGYSLARNRTIGFHHPAVLMRRDVIRAVGGYRHQFWPADDIDLWNRVVDHYAASIRAGAAPPVLVQAEYLMRYRIHGASVSVGSSRLAGQRYEWMAASMCSRRAGRAEPTWEQFLDDQRRLPLLRRFNRGRRDRARTLYKSAVFHFAKKHYLRCAPHLAAAALLEPSYVLPRLLPQLLPAGAAGEPYAKAGGAENWS